MKYKPERDLPDYAREAKTLSPSKLAEIVLNRRNREISAESVTMWFKRHPQVWEQLNKELVDGLPTEKQAADQTIFQNGNFQEIPSIKSWILEMNAREVGQESIQQRVNTLKSVCMGRFRIHGIDLVADGKWCFKHPDRLSLNDAIELITLLKAKGVDTVQYKGAAKDFLISKGVVVGKKIAVGRARGYGKYAQLYVEMSKLKQILGYVRSKSFKSYACDLFMFKTGTRISATLNALIENKIPGSSEWQIRVFDKGRKSKWPEGHPWDKMIDLELKAELDVLIADRKVGKIFEGLDQDDLSTLNREAITKFAPETIERYPDLSPNHFWRHMFAQHMLRQTDWNYGVVASLGGWTPQALEESYGRPPQAIVREWGSKYVLTLDAEEEIPLQIMNICSKARLKRGR
jgi:integrase